MSTFSVKSPRSTFIAVVAVVVFVNALAVVYSAARNRAQFAELTALRERHEALLVDYGRLELEEWTLAAHARVAKIATGQFDMQPPKDVRIVEVK